LLESRQIPTALRALLLSQKSKESPEILDSLLKVSKLAAC